MGAWSLAPSATRPRTGSLVDAGGLQARGEGGAEEDVVDPEAMVVFPATAQVGPEGPG